MRFDEFMHLALHDPQRGYYARRIQSVGGRGDFTTAPMLSNLPARSIARWADLALRETSCRDLIEVGPGEGLLTASVLKHLPLLRRLRTRMHLVETSTPLAERQKALLGNRVHHHTDLKSALALCKGRAVIFSNELVDAFPVRRFESTSNGWREIHVDLSPNSTATENLQPIDQPPSSSLWKINFPIGQRIEIHHAYQHWLTTWMPDWKAGKILTIDYGNTADQLFHRRPHGTLRAYLLQQRLEGPAIYQNIGRQDLTSDVNFTDLIHWSQPWTSIHHLQSLTAFLTNHTTPGSEIDRAMCDESGAGSAFQVLEQSR
jgi:SAM-dependent MidA family methyltransferase